MHWHLFTVDPFSPNSLFSVLILMLFLPVPVSIFMLTFLSCWCSSPDGYRYEDIFLCFIIIISYPWLDKTDSANHADMVGRGVGGHAILVGVDNHCGHVLFSTILVYSRFLLTTSRLIMSLFLAESTLLTCCCAFLLLLMGFFSAFPTLVLFPLGLPFWDPCLLLFMLAWTLPLSGLLPLPLR